MIEKLIDSNKDYVNIDVPLSRDGSKVLNSRVSLDIIYELPQLLLAKFLINCSGVITKEQFILFGYI